MNPAIVRGSTIIMGHVTAGGGIGGTSDHNKLKNRDAADQHPMSAITGLTAATDTINANIDALGAGSFVLDLTTQGTGVINQAPMWYVVDAATRQKFFAAANANQPLFVRFAEVLTNTEITTTWLLPLRKSVEETSQSTSTLYIADDGTTTWKFNAMERFRISVERSSDLPAVTSSDNGKFAQVVNGAWAAIEVASAEEETF